MRHSAHPGAGTNTVRHWLRMVLACLPLVAALPSAACAADAVKPDAIIAPRVTVAPAVLRELVETVTVTGTLVPREEVYAGAEINGLRIVEILAEEGDTVTKGQVLVRLSRETLDAKVAQSDAGIARAEATIAQAKSQIVAAEVSLKFANTDLDRARKLIQRGVSTQAIIDQKTSVANTASAQLQVAKDSVRAALADKNNLLAQRRELMVQVANIEIKAPAAGLVSNRTAKIGALVAVAGPPLFKIIKNNEIELDGEVTEQRLLSIRKGQPATITLANGEELLGAVRLVSPQIDPASRLGAVRISLQDKNRDIARAGAFARALVEIRRTKAITVPASAILYDNRQARVQIANGATVQARRVALGLVTGGLAEILEGVKSGERVILRAGAFLRDGDAITPVNAKGETQ